MPSPELVWIIDDDQSIRWVLDKALAQADLHTCVFDSAEAALAKLAKAPPSAILTDIRMPGMDGLGLLAQVRQTCPQVPVIIMTAHSDLDSAIQSYQGGACEYLPKPFDVDEAVALVRRALAHAREARAALDNHSATASADIQTDGLIGEAPAMQEVFRTIGRLSQSHITVLINGASGTGKELVAQALHRHSPRRAAPFIALNMAAIPRDLIESELFGHERGAFTGATAQRQGRFEQAQGGTLFLDEIGDMPLEAQTRLLRVLSEGSFHRVGGHTAIRADVRIIAATHKNLEELVKQGKFREDLFYRLNVIRLPLPPLRTRREDVPALTTYFMQRAAEQMNTAPKQLHPAAMQMMQSFEWRGNVRQLENVCLWLTVMATGDTVMIDDLPPELLENIPSTLNNQQQHVSSQDAIENNHLQSQDTFGTQSWQQALAIWAKQSLQAGATDILQTATPEFERVLLTAALHHSGGKKIAAANLLGWGRNTLTRKLQQLNLSSYQE